MLIELPAHEAIAGWERASEDLCGAELFRQPDPDFRAFYLRQAMAGCTGEQILDTLKLEPEWIAKHSVQAVPTLTRLLPNGRRLVNAEGLRFQWRGLTAFRLLEMLATQKHSEVCGFLDWAASNRVTVLRTLTMCSDVFSLSPESGRANLPRLLELCRARGLYLEAVGLADTKAAGTTREQAQRHLSDLGAICRENENAVLEVANEPRHDTQQDWVGEPSALRELALLVPDVVPLALGAAHGSDDENAEFAISPAVYVTIHSDRRDGDGGWRHVRHMREMEAMSCSVGKPVIDDEPIGAASEFVAGKRENDPAKWWARGALSRILRIGSTCHLESGLHCTIPTWRELACVEAWRDGLDALPPDLEDHTRFANTGWTPPNPESPVKRIDESKVVRAYSATDASGASAWTCALGVTDAAGLEWREDWHPALVAERPGVQVYYAERR